MRLIPRVDVPEAEVMPRPHWVQYGLRSADTEYRYWYGFLRLPIVWGFEDRFAGACKVYQDGTADYPYERRQLCLMFFPGRRPRPFITYWEKCNPEAEAGG